MLPTILAEIISILLLFVVLGFAVLRSRGLPDAVAAIPAAVAMSPVLVLAVLALWLSLRLFGG
ncbi:MAG: hypothetical protein WCF33_03195 [Pseudonocardiaceae bacterium]